MFESETAAAIHTSAETAPADDPARRSLPDVAQTFDKMLTPDRSNQVRFGAQNELLRLSQIEALTAVRNCFKEGISPAHIVQPGGTGKTREAIIAAHVLHQHEKNTLFVVPSQQAVQDFAEKTRILCPDLDVGTIYQVEKRIGRITYCTYASLLRYILGKDAEAEARSFEVTQTEDSQYSSTEVSESAANERFTIHPADYDLVIWDEAHRYLTPSAQKLVANFDHAANIALTATPRYYGGKEVANIFGPNIHHLDLKTAVERKEISDFRNLLITTEIRTGLKLSSPDQEENAEVARAIDIPSRNKIFPDFYRNAKITIEGETYTLLGEPTIVFGASIDHVHDIAQAFNDALMPALKTDEEFRSFLRAKGIDPDAVEQIAAPIHSGSNKKHQSMSLSERNALTDRYHQRKVLVLASTSVLQQSFDSLSTSVVIDSVPRQTYVGVGQAGMRSLRWLPEKKMAFIINTQDADHPSLTFHDFQASRGKEEGVIVEIANSDTSKEKSIPQTKKDRNLAKYNITYGTSLVDLAERRKAQAGQLYRDDYETSSRHLTLLGFEKVNQLIHDIETGDASAVGTFIGVIQPWIARTRELIDPQIFGEDFEDEEMLENAVLDILISLIGATKRGIIPTWSRFSTRFQQDYRRQCLTIQRNHLPTMSLHERVDNAHRESHLHETDPDELMAICEPAKIPLSETLPSKHDFDSENAGQKIDVETMHSKIHKTLNTLSYREREIIKLRYGLGDGYAYSLEEVGQLFKATRERVRQIEVKAVRKLQLPSRAEYLKSFDPGERPIVLVERWEAEQKRAKEAKEQEEKNNAILEKIEGRLLHQKQIIQSVFRNNLLIPKICGNTGIPEHVIKALSEIESTQIDHLTDALDNRVLTRIGNALIVLRVPPEMINTFDLAIENLKELMTIFVAMGGKPVKYKSF